MAEPPVAAPCVIGLGGIKPGTYVEYGVLALGRAKPYPAPHGTPEEVFAWARRVLCDEPVLVRRVVTVSDWTPDNAGSPGAGVIPQEGYGL